MSLTEGEWKRNRIIYFDNYFSSIPLLKKLTAQEILACGTFLPESDASDRKGLPDNISDIMIIVFLQWASEFGSRKTTRPCMWLATFMEVNGLT